MTEAEIQVICFAKWPQIHSRDKNPENLPPQAERIIASNPEVPVILRRTTFLSFIASALILTPGVGAAQSAAAPLHTGDEFPHFSSLTLNGKMLELPLPPGGPPAIVLFSLSRASGTDSGLWSKQLSKDFPKLPICTIMLLEPVPRFFRGMVVSGVKSGMSPFIQDRAVALYKDEALWKQRLNVTDDKRAYVLLLGPDGHIRWSNAGPFTDAEYAQLRTLVQTLEKDQSRK
jgi:ATP10 protein